MPGIRNSQRGLYISRNLRCRQPSRQVLRCDSRLRPSTPNLVGFRHSLASRGRNLLLFSRLMGLMVDSNRGHKVVLPYNYLPRAGWDEIFKEADLTVDHWIHRVGLYPLLAGWVFDRRLHFVARLIKHSMQKRAGGDPYIVSPMLWFIKLSTSKRSS